MGKIQGRNDRQKNVKRKKKAKKKAQQGVIGVYGGNTHICVPIIRYSYSTKGLMVCCWFILLINN